MISRPTVALLEHFLRNKRPFAGGMYADVYHIGLNMVLKIARPDGTMHYANWCHRRMKQFGRDSVEMCNLPEVFHFGKFISSVKEGSEQEYWFSVMPFYLSHDEANKCEAIAKRGSSYEALREVCRLIDLHFGPGWLDNHAGNRMYDVRRKQWVMTDPMSDDADNVSSADKISQFRRFDIKSPAAWKRRPWEQLTRVAA